jgi:hypothetical protein
MSAERWVGGGAIGIEPGDSGDRLAWLGAIVRVHPGFKNRVGRVTLGAAASRTGTARRRPGASAPRHRLPGVPGKAKGESADGFDRGFRKDAPVTARAPSRSSVRGHRGSLAPPGVSRDYVAEVAGARGPRARGLAQELCLQEQEDRRRSQELEERGEECHGRSARRSILCKRAADILVVAILDAPLEAHFLVRYGANCSLLIASLVVGFSR